MRPEICPVCNKTDCTHDMCDIMYVLRKKNKPVYKSCNCMALHKDEEFSICPRCGKKMCPSCTRYDGKHKGNYCWIPGRLKIEQIPWTDTYIVEDEDTGEVSTTTF